MISHEDNPDLAAVALPSSSVAQDNAYELDFTRVLTTARIAFYDDLMSAPRVTEVSPNDTASFIESLASQIYDQSSRAGGRVPYTVIREVTENFIHAHFKEVVVSIFDKGNTIRFADQGPGIPNALQAQQPGFSSAIEPMKKYIRGVGSGLPIVREYLSLSQGEIDIEDNLGVGAVVTISLAGSDSTLARYEAGVAASPDLGPGSPATITAPPADSSLSDAPLSTARRSSTPGGYTQADVPADDRRGHSHDLPRRSAHAPERASSLSSASSSSLPEGLSVLSAAASDSPSASSTSRSQENQMFADHRGKYPVPHLSPREQSILAMLLDEGALGVTEVSRLVDIPGSSAHASLQKLEQSGLVERAGKKRVLTDIGHRIALNL